VRAADGQGPDGLASAIAARVTTWPGATVGDQDTLRALYTADMNMQAWINYLLAGLAIAYAAIASVNTLAVAVLARRREFAVQRLAGATRKHVTRMLCLESGFIAVAALVLGTVIAAFTVLPMALASGAIIPSGPLWVYPAVIAAVALIVWPVTVATAHKAMSEKPIDAVVAP
jgi:putative ABC transport system permease protein